MRKKAPVSGCLRKPEEILVVNTACWVSKGIYQKRKSQIFQPNICVFCSKCSINSGTKSFSPTHFEGSVGLKSGVTTHPNEGFLRWVVSTNQPINLVFFCQEPMVSSKISWWKHVEIMMFTPWNRTSKAVSRFAGADTRCWTLKAGGQKPWSLWRFWWFWAFEKPWDFKIL